VALNQLIELVVSVKPSATILQFIGLAPKLFPQPVRDFGGGH
jgi:hypothetical protein